MLLGKHKQTGFTIVELLIVIVVIGILAALVLNSFAGAQVKARNADTIQAVRQFVSAIRNYSVENGQYPLANPASALYMCLGEGYVGANCAGAGGSGGCNIGTAYENIALSNSLRKYMGNVAQLPTISKRSVNFCNGQFIGGYYIIDPGILTTPYINYFLNGNVPCGNVPGETITRQVGSDNNATMCRVEFPAV